MKVSVLKKSNWNMFAYAVSDVQEKYKSFFEDELYWQVENTFIKQYSGVSDMDVITENFKKNGAEALEQMLKIQPAPWEKGLQSFIDKIFDTGIEWYVHGSCAMSLWGIEVEPRNVDIIIPDPENLQKVRELFLDETIYPVERCENWVMGGIGGLFMGANISLAFHNKESQPFDTKPLKEIDWKGARIKVSPLEWLKRDNENYNRPDRVRLIDEFMSKIHK